MKEILPILQIQNHFNNIILNDLKPICNCWIAGGSVLNYAIGKNLVSDYDLFFPNAMEHFKCLKHFMSKGGEIVYESEKGVKIKYKDNIYDLVKVYFNSVDELLDDFDITACKIAVSYEGVHLKDEVKSDIIHRELHIVNYKNPYVLFKRIIKYMSKGFSISNKEIANFIINVKETPISEKEMEKLTEISEEESSYD